MIGSAARTISLPIRANTQSVTSVFGRSGSPTANGCWRSDVGQVMAWSAWQTTSVTTGQVHGVDLSWGMMAVARRRVQSAALRNVTLTIGDARVLCFRSSVFDAVFMSFTLELFEEAIPNVLAEVRRVLRVGGRVGIVAMADSGQTNAMIDLYRMATSALAAFHRLQAHRCRRRSSGRRTSKHETAHVTAIWGLPVVAAIGVKASVGSQEGSTA